MNVELSTRQCAELFDVSSRTIQAWGQAGCPQVGRNRWDLKEIFSFWIENINSSQIDEDETMVEIKRGYWREKSEGEKLRNQKTREELVPWSEVEAQWAGRVALVTSGLEAFKFRLAPILEGKTRKAMQKILGDEVRYLRESYARDGKYTPKSGNRPATSATK